MKNVAFLIVYWLVSTSCSSYEGKIDSIGLKDITIRYGRSMPNRTINNSMLINDIGDVSMFLHEYAHILYHYRLPPNDRLRKALLKVYPLPASIIPNEDNRELQDFITTQSNWGIQYPFKHMKIDSEEQRVREMMSNLFVIFTMDRGMKGFIKENYIEIYKEYEIYYNNLKR